jgi:hypothetical protein
VFDGSSEILLGRLSKAAESIGSDLNNALEEFAKKVNLIDQLMTDLSNIPFTIQVEVTLSVLWEAHHEDPAQAKKRSDVVETITNILSQVQYWKEAEQLRMQ